MASHLRYKCECYVLSLQSRIAGQKAGGAIINTASVNAFQPSPGLLAYATTKGAIVTFTRALSQMALKQGVRVNAVAPGPVWTPLIPWSMPEEKVKKFGKALRWRVPRNRQNSLPYMCSWRPMIPVTPREQCSTSRVASYFHRLSLSAIMT